MNPTTEQIIKQAQGNTTTYITEHDHKKAKQRVKAGILS